MKINRTKERIKKTGEIFTPVPLVQEILNKLPTELWTDDSKTFLDPACGEGVFLTEVLKRKIANNHSPVQALSTIYGVDIMPDNVEKTRINLLNIVLTYKDIDAERCGEIVLKNIVCADALTYDFEFDGTEPPLSSYAQSMVT
jgi:type I restriction-modification system DNA methylase subunit